VTIIILQEKGGGKHEKISIKFYYFLTLCFNVYGQARYDQDLSTTSDVLFNMVKQGSTYHASGGFDNESETVTVTTVDVCTQ